MWSYVVCTYCRNHRLSLSLLFAVLIVVFFGTRRSKHKNTCGRCTCVFSYGYGLSFVRHLVFLFKSSPACVKCAVRKLVKPVQNFVQMPTSSSVNIFVVDSNFHRFVITKTINNCHVEHLDLYFGFFVLSLVFLSIFHATRFISVVHSAKSHRD